MNILWILLIIVLVVALVPQTGWHHYGYAPSGILGVVVVIILLLFLLGRL